MRFQLLQKLQPTGGGHTGGGHTGGGHTGGGHTGWGRGPITAGKTPFCLFVMEAIGVFPPKRASSLPGAVHRERFPASAVCQAPVGDRGCRVFLR